MSIHPGPTVDSGLWVEREATAKAWQEGMAPIRNHANNKGLVDDLGLPSYVGPGKYELLASLCSLPDDLRGDPDVGRVDIEYNARCLYVPEWLALLWGLVGGRELALAARAIQPRPDV